MRLFDAIFMLFGVLCTTIEGAQILGTGRPKQAGDLTGTVQGSARRMGGWNAGQFEEAADWRSRMVGGQGVSPSSVSGLRPYHTRRIPINAYKSSWRRSSVGHTQQSYTQLLVCSLCFFYTCSHRSRNRSRKVLIAQIY